MREIKNWEAGFKKSQRMKYKLDVSPKSQNTFFSPISSCMQVVSGFIYSFLRFLPLPKKSRCTAIQTVGLTAMKNKILENQQQCPNNTPNTLLTVFIDIVYSKRQGC